LAGPCGNGVYAVGPYLGLEQSWHALKLKGDLTQIKHKSSKPYGLLGLKLSDSLSLELGGNLKSHKKTVHASPKNGGWFSHAASAVTPKATTKSRKVDVRLIQSFPLDEQVKGLMGLGVSHLKLGYDDGVWRAKSAKLVPSALVGLEAKLSPQLRLRASAHYSHGLKSTVADMRAKQSLSGHLGLLFDLP
jgi:hypothetical protein